ncbi:uncharacterized protein LOC123483015 [Coregonus clupeaformis]|uniref:uncharacterized protein LOC123483015 n=1 Tax=Coregonus clupeaformis TaxID=59861 RepID=UPI001E1C4F14|nr:uncharacterized protein LOC123483015 [Coregonus clupeaformis]
MYEGKSVGEGGSQHFDIDRKSNLIYQYLETKSLFLLHICWLEIIAGIRVEPSVDQYGLKGGSICLAVPEPEILKGLQWKTGSDVIVDDKEISPKYKEKVDYNSVNHSLCIKNLLNTDSRIYMGSAINQRDWTDSTTTYRLKVLDHVPKPVMDVTSLFNTSVGLCDVTVNCSVKDGWMLSVCGGGQCTRSQQLLSLSGVNIIISNGNGSFQCTSSNHVSTQTISQPMEDICKVHSSIHLPVRLEAEPHVDIV